MTSPFDDNSRLVYSSETGRICPRCQKPVSRCTCKPGKKAPSPAGKVKVPDDGVLRVSREVQGRKGKGVTVIRGFSLVPAELEQLAQELKKRCGAGGTVKDRCIEIQGDHRDAVVAELVSRGFKAKKAGG